MAKINIDLRRLPDITNDVFYPLFQDRNRYLVLKGGGGSGKSVFAADKVVFRILTEPGHRILVVRKVARTIRESIFAQIQESIARFGVGKLFRINKSDLYIKCANGNEILFAGLDDVEKLKSIVGITAIWIEEASEISAEDFRQLDIRLRGRTKWYKQIMLSFNPISVTNWLKAEFFDNWKDNATILETTYKDNRFLDAEAIAVLESFRDTDQYYYMVYCLGQWGVYGKTVFPAQVVADRLEYMKNHNHVVKRGFFAYDYENHEIVQGSIQFIEDEDGIIEIYKDVECGHPYVLGGDTAGEGSDWFSAHVIDNSTGEQVARLHLPDDEDEYARQVYCLGVHYNYALVGLEVNFSTHPTKELVRWKYNNMYLRNREDVLGTKIERKYGFQTTKLTRPIIIAGLKQIVKENTEYIQDVKTLEEMLTFIKNPDTGRPEAESGAHDDLVIGLAITYYIRDQQKYAVQQPKEEKTVIQKDKERLERKLRRGMPPGMRKVL